MRIFLPHEHGVLVGALPPLLRVEARHRARAVRAHPPGDPPDLLLCHLSPGGAAGELLAAARAAGEGATGSHALSVPAASLPPPLRPSRRGASSGAGGWLGGEAGAHGDQW